MNLSQRQKLLATVAIAAVALLAGDKLILGPVLRAWQSRSERLTTLRREVEEGRALLARGPSANGRPGLRERWDKIRKAALSSEVSVAENQMLKALDRWSQESRVGVNSLKPQWKHGQGDYATMECRVDATGNLSSLARFLYAIENARRSDRDPLAIKIDVLELTARDDQGDRMTLGMQLSALQLNPPAKR